MSAKRVHHFKVTTKIAELINKKIQQIDIYLQEIQFVNQAQSLMARGIIQRRIRYLEFDGRPRKVDDRIQFEINIGDLSVESLSLLKADLKQDFFLLQPGKVGESLALLEQGFTIIVRKFVIEAEEKLKSLLINSIIASNNAQVILNIPLKFPRQFGQPKSFNGGIHFADDYQSIPLIEGEVIGAITYRTAAGLLKEMDLKEPVSILVNSPVPNQNQSFRVFGDISDITWKLDLVNQNWLMGFKIDYRWYLTELKDLLCKERITENGFKTHKIKTLVLAEEHSFDLAKTLSFPFYKPVASLEVNLEKVSYTTKPTKKGLVVTTNLTLGIFFTELPGLEKYQNEEVQFEELMTIDFVEEAPDKKHSLVTDLKIEIINFALVGQELRVVVNCLYYLKTYVYQISYITEDSTSKEAIFAETWIGNKTFTLMGEELFSLRCQPFRVEQLKSRLLHLDPVVKNGWLSVDGCLEVEIAYIDQEHTFHEDTFKVLFQDSFIWAQLQSEIKVELSGQVEYNTFHLNQSQIDYKYLVSLSVEAFQEQELPVVTMVNQVKTISQIEKVSSKIPDQSPIGKLLIEGEISLKQGNIKEIIGSKTLISQFDCRQSLKATLVKGNLIGELEYWDEERYLQKETIEFPFWRFIQNNSNIQWERFRLVPEIANYSYSPLKAGLWQKGSVKVRFELEFKHTLVEGETI